METVIYKIEEKEIELKLDKERNTVWATQSEMAKLFNVGRSWIARIIKEEGENGSTCSYYEQVALNGKEYKIKHYSLELILEVGYKIDVNKALEFKEWANQLLSESKDIESYKSPMPVEVFEDNDFKLKVLISPKENTVWLSQEQMSKLFDVARNTISEHISNVLKDEELDERSVGFSDIPMLNKRVKIYNLDMIISVGYRVKSKRGVFFRKWATKILSNYLMKGYAIDESRVTLYKENYMELNNTVLRLEGRVNDVENKIDVYKEEMIERDKRITNLESKKREEINSMIFYKGEFYDAYSFIVKLVKKANKELVLIDNYVDNTTLDILSNKNSDVDLTIITNSNLSNISINTFNKQYPTLTIKNNYSFHDRFLIIDNKELYVIGGSIKDIGKKCFGIVKMETKDLNKLLVVV